VWMYVIEGWAIICFSHTFD